MADNLLHRHEERDISAIAVTRFGIGLAFVIVVSMFALWGLFNFFKNRIERRLTEAPAANVGQQRLPPEPRLQANPRIDLRDIRATEDKLLNQYGWIDQSKGIVRIPIDRAMDLLAQQGLPARPSAPAPAGSPNNPTQSSAGPILQQPGGPLAPLLTPRGNN